MVGVRGYGLSIVRNPSPGSLCDPTSPKGRGKKESRALAQPKPARDDAAQHFGGSALNGQFWRGLDRERQLIFQRLMVRRVGVDEGGEIAHPVRQLLLPDSADV